MIPIHVTRYKGRNFPSEFRIGWASWDKKAFQEQSIKWAYKDAVGKVSRGCPELPFDVLVDMVIYAYGKGMLSPNDVLNLKKTLVP